MKSVNALYNHYVDCESAALTMRGPSYIVTTAPQICGGQRCARRCHGEGSPTWRRPRLSRCRRASHVSFRGSGREGTAMMVSSSSGASARMSS